MTVPVCLSGGPVEPFGLGVDAHLALTAAAAPGAGDRVLLAAEAGDQLAGAPTGHTLPRPMGRHLHLVVVLLVSHGGRG